MINVIHIKSYAHSGSTLMNILLARNKGVFAGGHLFRYKRLWNKENKFKTSDGTLIKDCAFWNKVKKYLDMNQTPVCDTGSMSEINGNDIKRLFRAILDCSNCHVICDNSKSRMFDNIIYGDGFNTLMVHVIRDGRAVYYSMQKKSKVSYFMPLRWSLSNFLIWFKNRNKRNYILVRYEDLMADTERCLEEILRKSSDFYQIDIEKLKSEGCNSIPYMFAGNRMRSHFDGTIKHDEEYLTKISGFKWLYLTVIMFPVLFLFRYELRKNHA